MVIVVALATRFLNVLGDRRVAKVLFSSDVCKSSLHTSHTVDGSYNNTYTDTSGSGLITGPSSILPAMTQRWPIPTTFSDKGIV